MALPKTKTPPSNNINEYTYLIYGEPKVGKTTFASNFPNAIFAATEAGHRFVEVYKQDIRNWDDFKQLARDLIKEEHEFKTLVVDTVDNLYTMAAKSVCMEMGISHQSDADFGKAYDRIKQQLMDIITALTQRGMGMVFLSHVDTREITHHRNVSDGKGGHVVAEVKTKVTDATLSGSAKKVIRGLCDMIFYCYIDDRGDRWLRTKQTETIVAGDRSGKLPAVMSLDYKQLEQALMGQTREGEA